MGPLNGFTVIELAGLGPAPMGSMILADMGANVIRVERPGAADPLASEPVSARNKKSVVLNLKAPEGVEALLKLIETADAFIDPYRPGVCEKLGFGPLGQVRVNTKSSGGWVVFWGKMDNFSPFPAKR